MILDNTNFWHSPVRSFMTRVELYQGSALADAYTAYYALKSFSIERVGEESKFFGFGVCQKMNLKLVDKDRYITITTEHSLKPYLSTGGELITSCPTFYVTRVNRDENTNELSVTAYDALYKAVEHTVNELTLTMPYTIRDFALACGNLLGCAGIVIQGLENEECFDTSYAEGANFEGTEDIRSALNAIAEVTQTIYYINNENNLVFKRLDLAGDPVLTIDKASYITLESSENRRLATITHATELGDNVSASTEATGSTQYIRDNPFWDLREDISTLVDNALAAVGGLTINQFSCSWRGNFSLEIGDKIGLITKDNETVFSYILDDVITYDGSLSEETQWNYTNDEAETETNSTSLGEVLNQTFARVDKANREITIQAGKVEGNTTAISAIRSDTESINNSVIKIQEDVKTVEGDLVTVTNKVETMVTAETFEIKINEVIEDGVKKVDSGTGFVFSGDGLTIDKTGTPIKTNINENGMRIYRNEEEVLTADNEGVKAEDLHATTYLIIGTNSRLENYGAGRTACFWIGN